MCESNYFELPINMFIIIISIIRTARHVQKNVTDSDCVGILVYAKLSSADFDNDNIYDNMIFSFHL